MLSDDRIYEVTQSTTIQAIENFARSRISRTAKFQILDLIMPKERKIRSIVGGLETSLGTGLWEPLGKCLAEENDFIVRNEKEVLNPKNPPQSVLDTVRAVLDDREHIRGHFNALSSKESIQKAWQSNPGTVPLQWEAPPRGHGVDIWLEKDGVNYIVDTKTVQPNVGSYQRFLKQIINWYYYFYSKYPNANLEARIVFPYNPYRPNNFWDHTINHGVPLEPGTEGWVQDDFWDLCTGRPNSYQHIERAFTHIGENGVVSDVLERLFED